MKRTMGEKRILEDYDKFTNSLTVLTFDLNGKRLSTYGGLNVFQAFKELVTKSKVDVEIIVCKDIPRGVYSNRIEDYKPFELKYNDFGTWYGYKQNN